MDTDYGSAADDERIALNALRSLAPRTGHRIIALMLTLLQQVEEIREDGTDGDRQAQEDDHDSPAYGARSAEDPGTGTDQGAAAGAGAREGLTLVPDRITPIVGWRVWQVVGVHGKKRLASQHVTPSAWRDRSSVGRFVWTPGKALRAVCEVPKHRHATCSCPIEPAPAASCSCGFYVARSLDLLPEDYLRKRKRWEDPYVVGRVALWGKVIEHEDGWRGEYAYPQAIYLEPEDAELRADLEVYGVPILSATNLPEAGRKVTKEGDDDGDYVPWKERVWPDAEGLAPDVAAMSIDDIGLASRARNALRGRNITRVGQLLGASDDEILRIKSIGRGTLMGIHECLVARGLRAAGEDLSAER